MRHLAGESRFQATLLPERLEDFVEPDHPVRVIDAFVDQLDMSQLGFTLAQTKRTGRKPYNPADLLKLYLYGFLNQVRSSRRLERECQRNLEVLWLMKRLAPDFKTIANFRQQNPGAIKAASRAFIQFCRRAELLVGAQVAIDGTKFRSAGSIDQTTTREKVDKQLAKVDARIQRYLDQLTEADSQEGESDLKRERVEHALSALRERQEKLQDHQQAMDAGLQDNHCLTEPEARVMRSGREGKICGYNIQSVVDTETGLIVHHELTDEATDNRQLEPMAREAKTVLQREQLEVLADAGYSNGEQLQQCDDQGIEACVPGNRSHNNQGAFYQRSEFLYNTEDNSFTCPAGERLRYTTLNNKKKMYNYSRTGCSQCALQSQCTKADKRWVSRHFYEDAFARSEARLAAEPERMRRRMRVEHPFAQLKHNRGWRRFLCWGMKTASAELGIAVLAYNLRRAIAMTGVEALMARLALKT